MLKLLSKMPEESLGKDWETAKEVLDGMEFGDEKILDVESMEVFKCWLWSLVKLTNSRKRFLVRRNKIICTTEQACYGK